MNDFETLILLCGSSVILWAMTFFIKPEPFEGEELDHYAYMIYLTDKKSVQQQLRSTSAI